MSGIPLLFVTSFNKDLYEVTGKRLIKSINRNKITGIYSKVLVTYEDFNFEIKEKNFFTYNLKNDEFLNNWLEKFKYLIPKQYGGTALECCCKIKTERDKWYGHFSGCAHSEWNRRASKWFRKIASLNYALTLNPEKILFLDSDVYFLRHVPFRVFNSIFSKNGLIYHLGKWRREQKTGIESGIIGFSREGGGFDFLNAVIDYFVSGKFQDHPRWDDGYIFRVVLDLFDKNKLQSTDLVKDYRKTSHVVNLGILRNFLIHDKGHHLKKYKIT
jgi:hypothetical protein